MRIKTGMFLCLAIAATASGCSGTRAHGVHRAETTASATRPKTIDPTRCQVAYRRAVVDCRAAADAPYDDCVNAAVVDLNACLDSL
jgi:hypothetical protein